MIRARILTVGVVSLVFYGAAAMAQHPTPKPPSTPSVASESPAAQSALEAVPESPLAAALRKAIASLPEDGSDEERNEHAALASFYEARRFAPLWIENGALTSKAAAVAAEIKDAGAWGLNPADFPLPEMKTQDSESAAAGEAMFAKAVLKYARYARGGRIIAPAELLNTNLDRRPQLVPPKDVLDGIASAGDAGAYLKGLNPQHPQFERLREKYIAAVADRKPEAKRLLANMEMWRWMAADMGDVHVLANVPEFMLRLVKNGTVIYTERIVVGEIGKQTSIFSRPLKHIVFRPMWRVPESIKVRELWPSLKRGGGLMRQYGLELETKDGQPLDWRTMDWSKEDIRDYEVVQPPGRKSVLGVVKFSFPSQHTIYMHDTPDRWMFNAAQRTLSHGCLRVQNPVRLAELILAEDKGWDAVKIADLIKDGPLNNEVAIDKKIRIHIVYFTAWVDDTGKLSLWKDIYGHEKRVSLALAGKWSEIDKGKDHLAPPEPLPPSAARIAETKPADEDTMVDPLANAIGGRF